MNCAHSWELFLVCLAIAGMSYLLHVLSGILILSRVFRIRYSHNLKITVKQLEIMLLQSLTLKRVLVSFPKCLMMIWR